MSNTSDYYHADLCLNKRQAPAVALQDVIQPYQGWTSVPGCCARLDSNGVSNGVSNEFVNATADRLMVSQNS